ncbi:MAG TPA: FAD-dependent oxidoreductase, partial [Gemmatimonadota bacterium]|nr:FAD-dependent oxidoreductase [Gemmatimonadota bacterium]
MTRAAGEAMRLEGGTLVLGAGIAGLAAARELAARSHPVALLEARGRAGGRIHTLRPEGARVPVELGAEFIHGEPFSLLALAREYDLEREAEGGGPREAGEPGDAGEPGSVAGSAGAGGPDEAGAPDGIEAVFARLGEARPDESLAAFVERVAPGPGSLELRRAVLGFAQGYHAADPRWVAARSLEGAGPGEAVSSSRLARGFGELVAALRAHVERLGARLVLDAPVSRVAWDRSGVRVRAGDREHVARRALVALPLGVLQAPPGVPGAVRFDPDPPRARRALEALAMGAAFRVVLRFAGPPPVRPHGFTTGVPGDFPVWWSRGPEGGAGGETVLTGWTGGPPARQLSGRRLEYVVQRALDSLAELPGT